MNVVVVGVDGGDIHIDIVDDLFPKQDRVGRGRWRVLKRSRCWQELSGLSK